MTVSMIAKVEAIFAQVVDLPSAERESQIVALALGDEALAREVRELLAQLEDDAFLDPDQFAREQSGLMFEGMLPVAARIGQYTVLGVLGAGGMGTVYLAEQARPRRQVALKVISGPVAREAMIARFEREAELLGRLSHPGIAQIYEAGVADYGLGPRPFIAMERIEGVPVSRFARERALNARDCADLVARIADAVEHAHLKGVIHRDLKPGNVLVDDRGSAKVVDFGVARAIDEEFDGAATATGGMLGTLAYMAPEQLRDARSVDSRADIYALGVILFELLTGRQPHDCKTGALTDVIKRVCDEPAPRVGDIDRSLRGELESIVACALEKDPARRYRSAAEFADDLRRWLRGEPIAARRDSLLDALGRRAKQYRRFVIVTGVALAMTMLAGAWAAAQASRNSRLASSERAARERAVLALDAAQRERSRADAEALRLRDQLYSSRIGFAYAAIVNGDASRARDMLDECAPEQRGWEWRFLSSMTDRSDRMIRVNPPGTGYLAVDMPRSRFAAARFGEPARVFDLRTGELLSEEMLEQGVFRLAFAFDGALCIANPSGRLERRPVNGERSVVLEETGAPGGYYSIRAVPRSESGDVIGASFDGIVRRLDSAGRVVWRREGFRTSALNVAESSDITVLGGAYGGVRAVRTSDGAPLWESLRLSDEARGVSVSSDGLAVAVGSRSGEVALLDGRNGQTVWTRQLDSSRVTSIAMDEESGQILVGLTDGSILVLDASSGDERGKMLGHGGAVMSIEPLSDGRFLSYSRDGQARIWTVERALRENQLSTLIDRTGLSAVVASGGGFLVSSSGGAIYRESFGQVALVARSQGDAIWRLDANDIANRFAIANGDGSIELFTVDGLKTIRLERLAQARIAKVAFSPRGSLVAAVSDTGELIIVDAAHGDVVSRTKVHNGGAIGVRWSVDGESLWTVGTDGALHLWGVSTDGVMSAASPMFDRVLSPNGVWEVVVNHDGAYVAASGPDGVIFVLEVASGAIRELHGHVSEVFGLAFHPKENRLASVGADGRVRVWDVASGEQLLQLGSGGAALLAVAFDHSGDRLAAAGADGVLRVWDASGAVQGEVE